MLWPSSWANVIAARELLKVEYVTKLKAEDEKPTLKLFI